jgi:hypothetical protein
MEASAQKNCAFRPAFSVPLKDFGHILCPVLEVTSIYCARKKIGIPQTDQDGSPLCLCCAYLAGNLVLSTNVCRHDRLLIVGSPA